MHWQATILALAVCGLSLEAAGNCPHQGAIAGECVRTAYFYKPPVDGTPASFIARHFDLILLTHGDEGYRRELRQAGYDGPILQTVGANEAEGPGPYANRYAHCDPAYVPYMRTVTDEPGLFCRDVHVHESWFLHNRGGARLYSRTLSANHIWRTTYAMNPASRGWQQFVAQRLVQERRLGYNGIFLDNVWLSRAWTRQTANGTGGVVEFSSRAALQAAVAAYLRRLRQALPHVPIWANLTNDPDLEGDWNAYLPYLDGVMVENFLVGWSAKVELSPARRQAQMINIAAALRMGKKVLLVAQGRPHQRERWQRSLAAYWLLNNGHLYYRFADAFTAAYRNVNWLDAYDQGPGRALGAAKAQGWNWTRRFQSSHLPRGDRTAGARRGSIASGSKLAPAIHQLRLNLNWKYTEGISRSRQ